MNAPLRLAAVLLFVVLPSTAEAAKLYLASGMEIPVREYEVIDDRVRYYSTERSQWEEIPLRLVDLEKTERTAEREAKRLEALRAESRAERIAERKARTELHNVPIEEGVYHYLDDKATWVPQTEVSVDKSTKRGIFKVLAPIPIVAGKNTLFITEAQSRYVVNEARPIFFVRQLNLARFGIVKVEPETKKDRRVVQIINVVPQTKELHEEQEEVKVFRQQLASGVYRVWPVADLEPGEYAVIDYTPGEGDLRVWDFSVQPGAAEPSS